MTADNNTLRNASRCDFTPRSATTSFDDLKVGCLQRIADGIEKMAANHDALVRDRDFYKTQCEQYRAGNDRLFRRVAALRGTITKMKRKIP